MYRIQCNGSLNSLHSSQDELITFQLREDLGQNFLDSPPRPPTYSRDYYITLPFLVLDHFVEGELTAQSRGDWKILENLEMRNDTPAAGAGSSSKAS